MSFAFLIRSSYTSHKLQLCNIGPFAPLKTAYRDEVDRLNRGGIDAVGKEHFTYLYSPARDRALTKRNIRAGWAATGLLLLNLERVLRDMLKLLAEITVPTADDVAGTCSQDEVLYTPVTLVTLVTAEALILLHNLIKEDTHALDKTSKQRLQRHVQKLASAA
jgi:hypothetical protein